MRSLTRMSLPTRCAGQSPDAILRRTVFSETPSRFATSATLRNRSPGSGGPGSFPAWPSGACSSCNRPSRGGSLTPRASRASLKTLKASRAACRAIIRMSRVRSSSSLASAAGRLRMRRPSWPLYRLSALVLPAFLVVSHRSHSKRRPARSRSVLCDLGKYAGFCSRPKCLIVRRANSPRTIIGTISGAGLAGRVLCFLSAL